jgi:hypothetical protein
MMFYGVLNKLFGQKCKCKYTQFGYKMALSLRVTMPSQSLQIYFKKKLDLLRVTTKYSPKEHDGN